MLTLIDFRLRFPEFSTTSDERIQFFIDTTTKQFSECIWGDLLDEGQAYYIAHMLTGAVSQQKGNTAAAYPVSNKKAGDLQVGYSAPNMTNWAVSETFYTSTSYGQYYMTLRNQTGAGLPYVAAFGEITLPGC